MVLDPVRDIVQILTLVVVVMLFVQMRNNRKRIPDPRREDYETIKVERKRPSLRNPMRTYATQYDDFKTKRGLYEPVKPRGRTREQEDELEV